jgi:hypothetical protein
MAKTKTQSIDNISNKGNFDSVLQMLEKKLAEIRTECQETGKYSKRIANFIKFMVVDLGMPDVLEEGVRKGDVWNKEEAKQTLLYVHKLLISANTLAQFYLNDITIDRQMEVEQLNTYVECNRDIFGNLKIVL